MKRAIIIHGWEGLPNEEWRPWLSSKLISQGWLVEIPEMPNTKTPNLNEWMEKLKSMKPDENTLLVGHSLSNALILKYLEKPENKAWGAVMVAAWDWLLENVKEYHLTFFETEFDYEKIKGKNIPLFIVNSTNDPWIDFEKAKLLKDKISANFVAIENAGHFMGKNGFIEFPQLLELITKNFTK